MVGKRVDCDIHADDNFSNLEKRVVVRPVFRNRLPGGHSEQEPPDPIPNSEVKLFSADDSVESLHAKVGHCQVFIRTPAELLCGGFFLIQ